MVDGSGRSGAGNGRRGGARTGPAGRGRGGVRSVLAGGRAWARDVLDRPLLSWHLLVAVFVLLLGLGLAMVLSSSAVTAFPSQASAFAVFGNQAVYAVVGLLGFGVAMGVPVRWVRRSAFPAVLVSVGLLVAVLVPGVGAQYNGARSWLVFGSLSFQPSELAKLALLLWMGQVLAARRHLLRSPRVVLVPVLPVFVLMVMLVVVEPSLGTAVVLSIVFLAVLFFAGAPRWVFAGMAGAAVAGVVYLASSAGYRAARVTAFLDPQAHPELTYQATQGMYALSDGGLFGIGLGHSMAKWGWLPNADSDFIFAVLGEELGLVGAGLVLVLFAVLAYTGLRIALRNVDPFIKITAAAGTVWLVGQAVINIGYVVGLLPVTGIPLPMISAGGTSLIITMVVFGLLGNFALREPKAAAALNARGTGPVARFLGIRPGHHTDPGAVSGMTGRNRKPRRRGAAESAARVAGPAPLGGSRPATPTGFASPRDSGTRRPPPGDPRRRAMFGDRPRGRR